MGGNGKEIIVVRYLNWIFFYILALWLGTKDNRDAIKSIATRWRSHLSWQRKIQFHHHEGSAKPVEY